MEKKWSLRLITALLWALAAASAVYWALRAGDPTAVMPALKVPPLEDPTQDASRQTAMAGLLGASGLTATATAGQALPTDRFKLMGVALDVAGNGAKGAALIAVDGLPARPFIVGSQITPEFILKALSQREVMLAQDMQAPAKIILSLSTANTADAHESKLPMTETSRRIDKTDIRRASKLDSRGG